MQQKVQLHWLNGSASEPQGVTWGVPWSTGELTRTEELALTDDSGVLVPVQSWPTAFWPDGSVKWTAHAASLTGRVGNGFLLYKGRSSQADDVRDAVTGRLQVTESDERVMVDTGAIQCSLPKRGRTLIESIVRGQHMVCCGAYLTGIREEESTVSGYVTRREQPLRSVIREVTVEQRGPVRAVVRIDGRHQIEGTDRQWLPFRLRLYFYAGQSSIQAVYTFFYDGNPHSDRIKGLGLRFSVPMTGALYNRHVRLTGDTGLFRESPKLLATNRMSERQEALYRLQDAGQPVRLDEAEDANLASLLDDSAVWDSFKLFQLSADSYSIRKRTGDTCAWVKAAEGCRAMGTVYAGDEFGGLSVSVRNFWEKHPSALEVSGMSGSEAGLTVWLWSPDAEAMDLRHYDTQTHVESSYEGFDEMRSTPYGIANTSELDIRCFDATPSSESLLAASRQTRSPARLICLPQMYYDKRTFGVWSMPDKRTEAKRFVEEQLDAIIQFYKDEIEQRRWYGFWDYGDVMHSYDPVRHTWRYDLGGCAWQNNELVPSMWLWYMFLRSGRADIFKLAEAMTRHTSEVDVYHFGEYAGLGSRHNVVHWGCGCKEARIGMAGLHRFYYYLTGDERVGDILDEVKDADYTTERLDPMRFYFPKDQYPTHARSGPDWSAFCSNWMTRWERFEDTRYRDKLLVGLNSLKQMPFRLLTGPTFGYDPKTGQLIHINDDNYMRHMMIVMGATQVWLELIPLLNDPEWSDMLAEFGEFYNLDDAEKDRRTGGALAGKHWGYNFASAGLVAFAAVHKKDPSLAQLAWSLLLGGTQPDLKLPVTAVPVLQEEFIRPIHELPSPATNVMSQWSLNAILCLELIGEPTLQDRSVKGEEAR